LGHKERGRRGQNGDKGGKEGIREGMERKGKEEWKGRTEVSEGRRGGEEREGSDFGTFEPPHSKILAKPLVTTFWLCNEYVFLCLETQNLNLITHMDND
jgi:hypothetical protein